MPRTSIKTQQLEQINMNESILVANGTPGILVIYSPVTNRTWKAEGFGKTIRMLVSDIIDVAANEPIIFENGWAVIMNDAVVEYMNFTELYKNIIKPNELETFLQLPENEIEDFLSIAPIGVKQSLAKILKQKIEKKDSYMDSTSRRKFFEQLLNIEFEPKI